MNLPRVLIVSTKEGKAKEIAENIGAERLSEEDDIVDYQMFIDGILGDENADFGELFGQFMAMKEQAASLPSNERRVMAEQVVTAFWKAMGGDLHYISMKK